MDFVIQRKKWRCGGGSISCPASQRGLGETELRNKKGHMCCLGQISLQLGQDAETISNVCSPFEIVVPTKAVQKVLIKDDELTDCAMSINDDERLTDKARERQLKKLFKEHGHTITFEGRYTRPFKASKKSKVKK